MMMTTADYIGKVSDNDDDREHTLQMCFETKYITGTSISISLDEAVEMIMRIIWFGWSIMEFRIVDVLSMPY